MKRRCDNTVGCWPRGLPRAGAGSAQVGLAAAGTAGRQCRRRITRRPRRQRL